MFDLINIGESYKEYLENLYINDGIVHVGLRLYINKEIDFNIALIEIIKAYRKKCEILEKQLEHIHLTSKELKLGE